MKNITRIAIAMLVFAVAIGLAMPVVPAAQLDTYPTQDTGPYANPSANHVADYVFVGVAGFGAVAAIAHPVHHHAAPPQPLG